MTLTFNEDESDHLASLLRIINDQQARETQNITVQRAEQEIIQIVRNKLVEQI